MTVNSAHIGSQAMINCSQHQPREVDAESGTSYSPCVR
jgi:hypothetical protein